MNSGRKGIVDPREEWRLDTRRLGKKVLLFDEVDSTNDLAAFLAEDAANDGVVILADAQTSGRGQHGRSWQSPPGSSVLLSVLLFPPPAMRRPVLLAAWAAVSVCETIWQCTGLSAKIKWPNDVLVHHRKVAGILIEQGRGTVVGIGLNVRQSTEELASAGLIEAGSLAMFSDRSQDCRQAAELLIRCLDEEYDRLCQGDLRTLEIAWKNRTELLGRLVEVECLDGNFRGRLFDMGWEAVEVQCSDGAIVRLKPEKVKHIRNF